MSSLLSLTPSYRALAKVYAAYPRRYLLTSVLPHLELREIGFDSEQVDGILYTVLEANHILIEHQILYIPFSTPSFPPSLSLAVSLSLSLILMPHKENL